MAATTGPRLKGETPMIGPARGFSRVSPVGLLRRHHLLLREANITRVVLLRARVRGDEIPSVPIAVGLLQSVQQQGRVIAYASR